MARPHIEWIQAQALPWRRDGIPARPGAEAKILSRDPESGAVSCILRYPPGYARGAEWLRSDEEFWILDGGIEVDGTSYGPHTPMPTCRATCPVAASRPHMGRRC